MSFALSAMPTRGVNAANDKAVSRRIQGSQRYAGF